MRQIKANKPDIAEILSRIQSLEQQNEMLVEQIKQQDTIIKKQAEKIAELLNSKVKIHIILNYRLKLMKNIKVFFQLSKLIQ